MSKLILASASPRRRELLQNLGYPFEIITADCNEIVDPTLSIADAIQQIAYQKAETVWMNNKDAIEIGADTMVCYDGKMLGKPKNRDDAKRMLGMLSGKTHTVISGVAILSQDKKETFYEETSVTFYPIEQKLLNKYLDSEEPYDKAGAYGIQGMGKLFVKEISGDYYNVVGLPIASVYRHLQAYIKDIKTKRDVCSKKLK